jgi:phosphoribosylamine--glycine ligase
MKILLIDASSSFLDFALRCTAEGHEVRVFMGPDKEGNRSKVGDGLLTKVTDWNPSMRWADLIMVSDNAKYITALESYRRRGFPIFGPNLATTNWELERGTGQRILAEAGIEVIPSTQFTSYDEAAAFVRKTKGRYVSKPSGDADKALSYVSKGMDDMLFMLGHWKKKGRAKAPFILQEFRPGIEMAVGGWFGKNGFSEYFLENFEHKKLMNDDKGCNTGEMGTVMKYVTESKLADAVLRPLEGELYRQGYAGFIDVAVMIGKDGTINPLEFTTRPGWPLFQIQQALHPEPCEWMLDLLNGTDCFEPDDRIATGVVMAMPDFPYSNLTKKDVTGFPVWGITEKNRRWVHPAEMMSGEATIDGKPEPMLVSCGDYVLVVSGVGDTVEKSREKAYKTVDELELPNSPLYRTDIGCRVMKQLPELQDLGFAEEWQ